MSEPTTTGSQGKRLWVKSLARVALDDSEELLQLRTGVNLLVGIPNTGKSSWVRLLDYIFGDSNSPPKALKRNLALKYKRARAVLSIDGREVSIERGWGPDAVQGKVTIDGVPVDQAEFSDVFLPKLGLPLLRIPQGNPYSARTWLRLGWRSLYRQIYRNENSWTDIADKQPASEQHAALVVLLGVGERVFPPAYGALVERTKQKLLLEGRKEQYISTLEEVTRELVSIREASVALTPDSISRAKERVQAEILGREQRRNDLLASLRHAVEAQSGLQQRDHAAAFQTVATDVATSQADREKLNVQLMATRQRISEIDRFREGVRDEIAKLGRLKAASDVLADLKVTHCPNCDQVIAADRVVAPGHCHVCMQPYTQPLADRSGGRERVEFEEGQLQSELNELEELLAELHKEERAAALAIRDVDGRIQTLEAHLAPVRSSAALLLPPELSLLDQERGQLTEQLRQLDRVDASLARRDELAANIDQLTRDIAKLELEVRAEQQGVPLTQLADALATHMNEYLNALNLSGVARWVAGRVSAKLTDSALTLFINNNPWPEVVGATNTCYFLVAYNYALLAMTGDQGNLYPGLSVIDLPANMSDVKIMKDQENYLIEPFSRLLEKPRYRECQLIAVGHAYDNIPNANRIPFTSVFSAPDAEEPVGDQEELGL